MTSTGFFLSGDAPDRAYRNVRDLYTGPFPKARMNTSRASTDTDGFLSSNPLEGETESSINQTRVSVIHRAKAGDATEFALIYGPLAYRMATRWGLGPDDAEDVMQQALFELLKMLPGFEYDRSRGRFKGLVKTIVRHRTVDFVRRRSRGATHEIPEEVEDVRSEQDDVFETEWQRAHLERALDRVRGEVKESTFRAFELRYVEGLSIQQVAETLDQTENQVSQNCRRVTQRLQSHMSEMLDE